ncbi:MAG: tRNA pseudouridine(55) synthase TruB [Chlorobi bacterium]|nr:tRNA pseudouridine(55) synthase TruB [Chlorobiota bacterium]
MLRFVTTEQELGYLFEPEGALILIDKPAGITSYQVVDRIKKITKRKAGHGGTLDPFATGLLIVGTGKHTKWLGRIINADKTYTGTMVLGVATETGDPETPVVKSCPVPDVSQEMIQKVIEKFTGKITQKPHKFSAVKIKGVPAYKLARQGKDPQIKERVVTIYELNLSNPRHRTITIQGKDYNVALLDFFVKCSKGTYIRSLVEDIGEFLGTCAFTLTLRRTAIGNLTVDNAWKFNQLIDLLEKAYENN